MLYSGTHRLADQTLCPPETSERFTSPPNFYCFMKSSSRCIPTATWSESNHGPSYSSSSSRRNSVNGSAPLGISTFGFPHGTSCNFVVMLSTAFTALVTFVSSVSSVELLLVSQIPDDLSSLRLSASTAVELSERWCEFFVAVQCKPTRVSAASTFTSAATKCEHLDAAGFVSQVCHVHS